jgi:hypothetical protein
LKFVIYNSSLTVQYINFTEITTLTTTTNALFWGNYAPFQYYRIQHCYFDLIEMIFMSKDGSNFEGSYLYVQLDRCTRPAMFYGNVDCSAVGIPGMANSFYWDNCYFTGINKVGTNVMLCSLD